jgi:hypothetical protein
MLNQPVTTMPESSAIALRPATLADVNLLRRWDEQPQVVAADPNDDWGWEVELARTPRWREQLIAELDGRPIGFIQIIDPAEEDSHYLKQYLTTPRAKATEIPRRDYSTSELGSTHQVDPKFSDA